MPGERGAGTSTLTIGGAGTATVRIPKWATGATLSVNGAPQPATPGANATINRAWAHHDSIVVSLPMALTLTSAPDDPAVQSVSYGPVLLAGQYGAFSQGPNPGSPPAPSPQALHHLPELDPASIAPTGTALTFTARADGSTVTLRPHFDTHNQFGTVYWTNPARSAYVRLRNHRSGLVIGVQDMSTVDGAAALQWTDSGTADHLWRLR